MLNINDQPVLTAFDWTYPHSLIDIQHCPEYVPGYVDLPYPAGILPAIGRHHPYVKVLGMVFSGTFFVFPRHYLQVGAVLGVDMLTQISPTYPNLFNGPPRSSR